MQNLKGNYTNKLIYKTENRLVDLEKEFMVTRGKGVGERIVGEFRIDMNTLLYSKWITKNLLYSTGNSAQCYVATWMGGKFGREWICVYV